MATMDSSAVVNSESAGQNSSSSLLNYAPAIPLSDISIPKTNVSRVIIDGTIGANEYNGSFYESFTGLTAYWEHNGVNLTIGLVSPGTGWVAIGFGEQMDGSNMIMGGSSNDVAYSIDLVGVGHLHFNDTEQGGTSDILEFAASENDTSTIFEFIIPLNSSDSLDPAMQENGEYSIFFGYHLTSDIITAQHSVYSNIFHALLRPFVISHATTINLEILTAVDQGEAFNISATLVDGSGQPLQGFEIEFFRVVVYGTLTIGNGTADATGKVTITYKSDHISGSQIFGAIFHELIIEGAAVHDLYEESQDTSELTFMVEKEPENLGRDILSFILQASVWLVFIIIWIIYFYMGYNIFRIATERSTKGGEPKDVNDQDPGENG